MEPRIVVEPITSRADARGVVIEPIGLDEIPAQKNVHLAITAPGHVRGNHFHRHGTEIAAVIGPVLIRYREGHEVRELRVAEGESYRLTFPPGVAHAFQNTGTTPQAIVSFNTLVHDPKNPDVVRDVLIEV
jgi:UDP-2-acetamido-2,6-beta-L-arabino-hexul-4-ose reductase